MEPTFPVCPGLRVFSGHKTSVLTPGKAWENQDKLVTSPGFHLMTLRNQLLSSWHLQNLCRRCVWTGQRTLDLKTWVWPSFGSSVTQGKSDNLWTSVHHPQNGDPNPCLQHPTRWLSRPTELVLWRHFMHYKVVQEYKVELLDILGRAQALGQADPSVNRAPHRAHYFISLRWFLSVKWGFKLPLS